MKKFSKNTGLRFKFNICVFKLLQTKSKLIVISIAFCRSLQSTKLSHIPSSLLSNLPNLNTL